MPLPCPAARHSVSTQPPACRRFCGRMAAASSLARRRCRLCRPLSCSISRTAATKTGGAFRHIATSATPRRRRLAPISLSAASAPGTGATTVNCKGGIGSASAQTADGCVLGAIAAVNAVGSALIGEGPWFWAAPFEHAGEFGGRGWPAPFPQAALEPRAKGGPGEHTTLVVVATDAVLTKAQANRLAVMAQSGMSRALYPVHTPLDGDVVFAASTGRRAAHRSGSRNSQPWRDAANVVARAIARGVFAAKALPFRPALPSWQEKFG